MAKIKLPFLDLHNQLFMNGSNLGMKINAAQRGAKMVLDTETNLIWIHFKGKTTFIPTSNVASGDALVSPEFLTEMFELAAEEEQPKAHLPPAIARAQKEVELQNLPDPMLPYDPNDEHAAALHRAAVRAASANSNRGNSAQTLSQTDSLIQQARMQAMGIKQHTPNAQVQNAQQVGETAALASTRGKRKAINHQELKTQIAQEMKVTNPNDL